MGKAVPKGLKSKAILLLKEYPEKFNAGFEHNKQVLQELGIPISKTNRNVIVGFVTRKIRQQNIKEKEKAEAAKKAQEKKETKPEEAK